MYRLSMVRLLQPLLSHYLREHHPWFTSTFQEKQLWCNKTRPACTVLIPLNSHDSPPLKQRHKTKTYHPYFVKRGQCTKYQLEARRLIFYIWQIIWETGYLSPILFILEDRDVIFCTYHRGQVVEWVATYNVSQLQVAVGQFLQNGRYGDFVFVWCPYVAYIYRNCFSHQYLPSIFKAPARTESIWPMSEGTVQYTGLL